MSSVTVVPTTLRFDHLGREQGYTADFASCIGQNRYGFIWIGTGEGLFRYDGFRFVAYRHDSAVAERIAAGAVNGLYFDSENRLWIGTDGGFDRYDPATDRFVHIALPRAPAATAPPEVNVVIAAGKSRL